MPETHILLIEDDPMSRKLFGGWITKLGFEAIYAVNGVEGMANARKFAPDLILLDYHLPEVDGLEVAKRLKEFNETKNIPVIFLTNEDLSPDAQNGLKQIGVEYLHKGEDFIVFEERLRKALDLSAPQASA